MEAVAPCPCPPAATATVTAAVTGFGCPGHGAVTAPSVGMIMNPTGDLEGTSPTPPLGVGLGVAKATSVIGIWTRVCSRRGGRGGRGVGSLCDKATRAVVGHASMRPMTHLVVCHGEDAEWLVAGLSTASPARVCV